MDLSVLAVDKHNVEHTKDEETMREHRFEKEYDKVVSRVMALKPETLLDALGAYGRTLAREAERAGCANPTRDELADEWLRRRLLTASHREEEESDAVRMNQHRSSPCALEDSSPTPAGEGPEPRLEPPEPAEGGPASDVRDAPT